MKLKDPAANWEDLRVMRSDTCEVQCSAVDDASASSLEAAQMGAKFNIMKMKLERERATWKLHLAAVRRFKEEEHVTQTTCWEAPPI